MKYKSVFPLVTTNRDNMANCLMNFPGRGLWSIFLARAQTVQGSAKNEEHDLRRLEALHLNGREVGSRALPFTSCLLTDIDKIKNIVAITHALAEANTSQVDYKYIELAAGSRQKFSKEFGRQDMYM